VEKVEQTVFERISEAQLAQLDADRKYWAGSKERAVLAERERLYTRAIQLCRDNCQCPSGPTQNEKKANWRYVKGTCPLCGVRMVLEREADAIRQSPTELPAGIDIIRNHILWRASNVYQNHIPMESSGMERYG